MEHDHHLTDRTVGLVQWLAHVLERGPIEVQVDVKILAASRTELEAGQMVQREADGGQPMVASPGMLLRPAEASRLDMARIVKPGR